MVNRNFLLLTFTLFCIAILALLFAGEKPNDQSKATKNTILLGASLPLSGINAHLGNDIAMGANTYFSHINAKGGVHGQKIEFIRFDDQYEPENTLANTKLLVEKENVFALFGFAGTPTVKKILPFVTENGIPFVAPYTGASFLRGDVPSNIINFRSSYIQEIESLVEHLVKIKGVSKFSIFYQNDDYGEEGYVALNKVLLKRNLKLSSEGTYKRNTLSIKQAVHDIQSSQPEAIILIGSYKPTALFIEKMRESYSKNVIFCPISFVNASVLMRELKGNGDNILFSQTIPSYDDFLSQEGAEYLNLFKFYYPDAKASLVSFESYLAAKVVVKALQNMEGEINRGAFLYQLKHIDHGLLDKIPLAYRNTQLSNQVYLSIHQNGKFYTIDKYQY